MRLFTLRSEPIYGWHVGHTKDGRQALMGIDLNAMVCLLFDPNGSLDTILEQPFRQDGQPCTVPLEEIPFRLTEEGNSLVEVRFEAWRQEIIVDEAPIQIQLFQHPKRFISLQELPSHFEEFLESPESYSAEYQDLYRREIRKWKERGDFTFNWNEDFDCSADGTVHSH